MNSNQSKTLQTFFNVYLPIVIFLIAFLWKFYYIDSRDICHDEPFTIFYAQHSFWDIVKLSANNEPNPPLFMVLLHFWIKLFGIGPTSVRFLPLIFNALTAVFIFLFGKKFFNVRTGTIASGIFILSTYHFYFGLETRAYALLSLATAASLFYFQSLIAKPRSIQYVVALVFWNFVLVYSHYFGWFIVFVQFVASLLYLKDRVVFKKIIVAIFATAFLFIPMAVVFVKQFLKSSQGTWVQPPTRYDFWDQLHWFLNSKQVFNIVIVILAIGLVYTIIRKAKFEFDKKILTVLLWWLIPYTVMFFVSFRVPMFINRYILFNTIGLYLLIAVLINYLFEQKLAIAAGMIILVAMFFKLQINSKEFYYREVKNWVFAVKAHSTEDSKVLLYPYWSDLSFMYYYDRSIFENYQKFDSLMGVNGIVRVWGIENLKSRVAEIGNGQIIYAHNGDLNDLDIYRYMDSTMVKTDSFFYPQCFFMAIYEVGK
jgi:hypothetical protein